jgi:hypothetical protein
MVSPVNELDETIREVLHEGDAGKRSTNGDREDLLDPVCIARVSVVVIVTHETVLREGIESSSRRAGR